MIHTVIYNQETPAYRLNLIKNSGFTPDIVSYLWNINAGITLGELEFSSILPKYPYILNIINWARMQGKKEPINKQISTTAGDTKRVLEIAT